MQELLVGQGLRNARRSAKMSQAELGDLVGVTGSAVGQWEAGTTAPSWKTAMRLMEVFEAIDNGQEPVKTHAPTTTAQHPTSSVTNDVLLEALNEMRDERRDDQRRLAALENKLRGLETTGDDDNDRERKRAR